MYLKKRIHEILDGTDPDDRAARAFHVLMLALISLNIGALVLETVESFHAVAHPYFRAIELVSLVVFSAEYVLRLWACTASPRYGHPVRGRLRYALTPLALIDLLAVLSFYLALFGVEARVVRMTRLFLIFWIAKIGRYSPALRTFGRLLRAKREELSVTLIVLLVLLLFTSCLMYYAENGRQPDKFSSIPAAMWWAVTTLTTVGYGDMVPVTPLGKVLAGTLAVLGIGVFALPAGILAAGFVEELQNRRNKGRLCPHCGKRIDEPHAT
jgi:voltage-gated potassium channel